MPKGKPIGPWDVLADPAFVRWRRLMRFLPRAPRCKLCLTPFRGTGALLRASSHVPSRKNPNLCRRCFEGAPLGGEEREIGVLFGDVRGFTAMSEKKRPDEVAALMNRFYGVATEVLTRHDAIIDKLVGDEVMALFAPPLVGPDHLEKMVSAAEELRAGAGYGTDAEPWIPLGIGLDFGRAYVGNVGTGAVKDFTALGDVVNTAARLQAEAAAGEIVLSQRVYDAVRGRYAGAREVSLDLKGKSEPVRAYVIAGYARPASSDEGRQEAARGRGPLP